MSIGVRDKMLRKASVTSRLPSRRGHSAVPHSRIPRIISRSMTNADISVLEQQLRQQALQIPNDEQTVSLTVVPYRHHKVSHVKAATVALDKRPQR